VELAHRQRQSDQEGALPCRSAAHRQRAGEHGALLPRPADSGGLPDLVSEADSRQRADLVPGCRVRTAAVHDGTGVDSGSADGALSRHQGHPGQRPDVVVLRHAHHLHVDDDGAVHGVPQLEPLHAPRDLLSGNPLLRWAVRSLEVAARDRRGVGRPLHRRLLAVRPVARLVCGGGVMPSPAIELANVTKVYRRYGARNFSTLKSALLNRSVLRDLRPSESFSAVKDLSFAVPTGSTFGVMGRNGSGKSTALKLVAGITKPTSGTVSVNGRISALIELGAGFHPEISGRENVFINGIMLGLTRREISRRFDEIVDFAEMADFIDAPVKTYSS